MNKSYKFHVNGMHCKACTVLIESELKELPEVCEVKASLDNHEVEISGDFGDKTMTHLAADLSEPLKKHGYQLAMEAQKHSVKWGQFQVALPLAAAFIAFTIVLQKLGIVNIISAEKVNYGTAFLVGIIASLSTCMAVVGGLVLGLSSMFAREGDKIKPQLMFHAGRLVSFFVLGGVIGALGSVFQFGIGATIVLNLVIGVVLLIMGLNLLDIIPSISKLLLSMPSNVGSRVNAIKKMNHTLMPLLLGVATFFMPCGFTQSIQIATLTTGNFLTGALTMLAFALGTLPVLALFSFGSSTIHKKANIGVFFKAAGLVVIYFALINIYSGLVTAGIIPPFINL